jgi:hypothetical protein
MGDKDDKNRSGHAQTRAQKSPILEVNPFLKNLLFPKIQYIARLISPE